MKKKLWMGVAAFIGIITMPAAILAEGQVSVTQKTMYEFDGEYSSDTGYIFAKLENNSAEPIAVEGGTLVAFTENDEILLTQEYVNAPNGTTVLEPGEYIYVYEFLWDTALKETNVADYKFSVSTKEKGSQIVRIPCEATFQIEGADSYDNDIFVTFTNIEKEEKYNMYIVAALYDAEEKLIFVDSSCITNIAIHPDSTVTVKLDIDDRLMNHYEANGIIPTTVDAMVYYEVG